MDINQAYTEVRADYKNYDETDPILKVFWHSPVNASLGEPVINNYDYRKVIIKEGKNIMKTNLNQVSAENKLNVIDVVYTDNSDLKENYMMKYELAERKLAPNIKFDEK